MWLVWVFTSYRCVVEGDIGAEVERNCFGKHTLKNKKKKGNFHQVTKLSDLIPT